MLRHYLFLKTSYVIFFCYLLFAGVFNTLQAEELFYEMGFVAEEPMPDDLVPIVPMPEPMQESIQEKLIETTKEEEFSENFAPKSEILATPRLNTNTEYSVQVPQLELETVTQPEYLNQKLVKSLSANNPKGRWLLIDTKTKRLEVKQGNNILAIFDGIAIGRNGAGFKNKRGDNVTPIGMYKIGWINRKSPFRIFYGFTYPSVENAKTALEKKLINQYDYQTIIDAHQRNRIPPQHTSLGGRIGLHGLGRANKIIHQEMNWTHGCVAVTNKQIDALDRWIRQGMQVKVQ